jgi:hypothetical protein
MKAKLLLFLWIATAQVGFSQDWDPFVLNQNSYYKQQENNSAKVENFLVDSILTNETGAVLYFNAKSELKPDCYKNIITDFVTWNWLKNPSKIDSLIKTNDSILFIAPSNNKLDTFIFKPYVKLNDSWTTNGIEIKCSKLGVLDVFGTQDSIKTFTCTGNGYDGKEFILSKNYGLIKFLPFMDFFNDAWHYSFPPYFVLVGYSNGGKSIGYTQPDFSDYFHLSAGDMLFWIDYYKSFDIMEPDRTRFYIDSVTAAYISPDSVLYKIKRTDYNENGSVSNVGNYSTCYLREVEGKVLKNHTSWVGVKNGADPSSNVFFLQSLYFKIENKDTITYAEYQFPGFRVDTINCETGFIMDYDLMVRYSTRGGEIYRGSFSWGESSTTQVGSVIKGVKFGYTEIPTGIVHVTEEPLTVYPNPVTDYLTIVSQNNTIDRIEIYDMGGRLLVAEPYTEKLFVGNLQSGVYTLKIWSNNNALKQVKIIKQ